MYKHKLYTKLYSLVNTPSFRKNPGCDYSTGRNTVNNHIHCVVYLPERRLAIFGNEHLTGLHTD